ncbi:hypothetical protein ACA910_020646 [Epithemia clementina (nom. ined.)]
MIAVHEGYQSTENLPASAERYSTIPQVNTQDFLDLITIYKSQDKKEEGLASRCSSSHSLFVLDAEKVKTEGVERCKNVLRRMQYLTCIAAIGGFLSGYNTGVISGALLPLTRVFHLSPFQEESIVSATILSAFASSMVGGMINHACGRRRTILAAALIFACGGIFLFGAQGFPMLVIGEIILGAGIGLESLTNPMYIAEVSKPDMRGMLVSAYAWMMCFGQFFAGIVDGIFGPYACGWRFMFGTAVLPGTVMFIGFLGLPESPAWLLSNGQEKKATEILKRFRDSDQDAYDECDDIKESLRHNAFSDNDDEPQTHASVWQIFRSASLRRALLVGCSLMFLQQFCGANVVMYYSATVYRMSGFHEVTALWLSSFTALAQLIGLALSLFLVETAGRRPLVLFSFAGVALCLLGLGFSFYLARITSAEVDNQLSDAECMQQPAIIWDGISKYCYDCTMIEGCGFCGGACLKGNVIGPFGGSSLCPANSEWRFEECDTPAQIAWMPVVLMVLYLIVFGIGAAGLPWTINSEIYPVQYRSLAVAISTGANWLCNLIISSTFLTISDPQVFTLYGSFWLYSVISFLGVAWLYFVLPETKGLSHEQIDHCFGNKAIGPKYTTRASEKVKLLLESEIEARYGSMAEQPQQVHQQPPA